MKGTKCARTYADPRPGADLLWGGLGGSFDTPATGR